MAAIHEEPDAATLIQNIMALAPGQRIMFYEGVTGWIHRNRDWQMLEDWFAKAQRDGLYDFTQKKIRPAFTGSEVSVFQYFACRRKKPAPQKRL